MLWKMGSSDCDEFVGSCQFQACDTLNVPCEASLDVIAEMCSEIRRNTNVC